MPNRTVKMTDELYDYLLGASMIEGDIFRRLREETAQMPQSGMQISPDQGQFFSFLINLIGAEKALEIGTFTGYSALAVASALPPHGKLVCSDVSEEWTSIGKRYWSEAGVAEKIDLRLGPAVETLDALIDEGESGNFDFAFIDANKVGYDEYYERALKLVRANGLIAIDNVLWNGNVADPTQTDESTEALRAIARKVRDDKRVGSCMLCVGDGITLARKLP